MVSARRSSGEVSLKESSVWKVLSHSGVRGIKACVQTVVRIKAVIT